MKKENIGAKLIEIPLIFSAVNFVIWVIIESIFNQPSYSNEIRDRADEIALFFLVISFIGLISMIIFVPLSMYFSKKYKTTNK